VNSAHCFGGQRSETHRLCAGLKGLDDICPPAVSFRRPAFAFRLAPSQSALTIHQDKSENQFLYNEALRVSLESMNREWGEFDLTQRGTRAPSDFHNMIVLKNPTITDGLNSRFGEYRVTYLDDASLISQWKRLRKPFAILSVGPVNRSEGRLKITIALSWISYRRTRLFIGLDSWANVYFRFDVILAL
jgi:hypothetical protein